MAVDIEAHLRLLLNDYQTAIESGIIEEILKTGELYFKALRKGEMTYEDREQMQRDIMSCAFKQKEF